MSIKKSEISNYRRQFLLISAAGAAGLASSSVFAKLRSVRSATKPDEQLQHKASSNQSNEHFVMYF